MATLNQKVIITGSTSRIGEAIARILSQKGSQVVINSVTSQEKGQQLAQELQGSYCSADVSIEANCERLPIGEK